MNMGKQKKKENECLLIVEFRFDGVDCWARQQTNADDGGGESAGAQWCVSVARSIIWYGLYKSDQFFIQGG